MHKLAEICIRRPVFATMLVLSLTVIGVFCFFGLGVDLLPKIDLPTVLITVSDPGAAAEQIETEITKKIEDAVNTISGIDDLRSTSVEGLSQVIVQFTLNKNGDVGAQEIRDKVSMIVGDLPETAKLPVIQKMDPDAQPIFQIVVSSPRPLREVTQVAKKKIKEQIENIDGVGQVLINGGAEREIHVTVDPDRLRAYNLTVNDVALALRSQNFELPGGRVDEGMRELTVRTVGRLSEPEQFNDIAVANRGAYVVRMRDLGTATDSEEELRSVARHNGNSAVTLVVSKQSGQNSVAVSDAVKEKLASISETLPKDMKIQLLADQSIFIRKAVSALESHLIEGSILASIVIFLFLMNIRTTLIAAIAIPTSIISTFGLMGAIGFTLNQLTMLALTLMVGIVIDDAIIVLENIFRFIEEKNMPPFQAAMGGTKEIGLAVMATTFSLLAVFVPVGFMGGIVGRFMSSFGFTAAFAIAVSLIVSFTLTPMLCSRFVKKRDRAHSSKESRLFQAVDRFYTRALVWALGHRRAIVGLCAVVILSVVPLFLLIPKNFMPQDDRSEFQINFRAPEGTSLAATENVAERIAREIRAFPEVTDTLTTVGGGQRAQVNTASINIKLKPLEERSVPQSEIMLRARDILQQFPNLRISVSSQTSAGSGNFAQADIQFVINGPALGMLENYSQALMQKMKVMPKLVDLDTSLIVGKPELRVQVNRKRAADLGVRVTDIATALNTLVAGQVVTTFNAGSDQYDVRLRAGSEFRSSVQRLKRLTVPSYKVKAGWVDLSEVVDIKEARAPSSIDRLNRQRQVTLTANLLPGGSQAKIIELVNQEVSALNLASGYTVVPTGMTKEMGRTAYYFVLAISLSFIFMYMVLAAQFESFLHPVTIMMSLPLAVPFGIFSLLIFGQPISIMSGLGLLLLFGIVKKNAILQIDHTIGLRASGMERDEAIVQANRDRLRPILMTTISLIAGMLPLVVATGTGAASNRGIGLLVIGGQSLCLLLTLLAVPVFYSIFDDAAAQPVWGKIAARWRAMTAFASRNRRIQGSTASIVADGAEQR
jgi:hydrophobic/amphiphilic exporter-1 (mainly G- bacteria), HAE1 family